MPEVNQKLVQQNRDLLNAAATGNLDTALSEHGQYITGTEAAALGRLSNDELTQLARINSKLFDVANQAVSPEGPLADWACGLVC
jgi:hypothetical protein